MIRVLACSTLLRISFLCDSSASQHILVSFSHGRLARWRKRRACDVGQLQLFRRFTYATAHSPTHPLLHLRYNSFSNPSLSPPTSQALHLRHLVSRSCEKDQFDTGMCWEALEWQRKEMRSSVLHAKTQLILQLFRHFTYVTAHSPTIPSLLTSQLILQPFFLFSYVTGSSLTSPGEPPMWEGPIWHGNVFRDTGVTEKGNAKQCTSCQNFRKPCISDTKTIVALPSTNLFDEDKHKLPSITMSTTILPVHRCGLGGSMRACQAAGPGSIPGQYKFPGWGFFLTCKTNVRKL